MDESVDAVNLQHEKIQSDDIQKAITAYSADIGNELGLEIRDVFSEAQDILYLFLGCPRRITLKDVFQRLQKAPIAAERFGDLVEILLWFSFLGVVVSPVGEEQEVYSYSVFYDMKKLKHLAGDLQNEDAVFAVHRAFWPFLEIEHEG